MLYYYHSHENLSNAFLHAFYERVIKVFPFIDHDIVIFYFCFWKKYCVRSVLSLLFSKNKTQILFSPLATWIDQVIQTFVLYLL